MFKVRISTDAYKNWEEWFNREINKITYHDKLCGFDRTSEVSTIRL